MSPPPPLKRRRLDSSSALSKPFTSPFKTPLKSNPNAPQSSPLHPPSTIETPSLPKSTARPHATPSPTKHTSPIKPLSPSKPSPELLALRRQQASLQSALSTARAELDTYAQALKIEESNKDKELEALIKKWRLVSKDAAEEVFGGVRDRVNRMGGVKAWRDAEKKKREGFGGSFGWGDDEQKPERNDDEQDESRDQEDVGEAEARDVAAGIAEDEKRRVKEEEAGDDEGFTMDLMLKSLNIELDVIGFDKEGQKWVH